MLNKVDTHYGHLIEDTPDGPVYQDDQTKVDFDNPRACLGCKVKILRGSHDPCIANLPGTYQACCGHGLATTPGGRLPGYAALKDGRCIRFSGCVGGERIKQAVAAALKGDELPEGFAFDEQRMWWEGLSETQRLYVQNRIVTLLARLVTEARNGAPPSPKFLAGEAMWWDGLDETEKSYVLGNMRAGLAELVQESLQHAEAETPAA